MSRHVASVIELKWEQDLELPPFAAELLVEAVLQIVDYFGAASYELYQIVADEHASVTPVTFDFLSFVS